MQDVAGEASFVAATLAAQAKHDMGLCSGRSDFEPALCFAHGLVVDLLKAELVDIEVEGFVLVADTYTDGADFREHSLVFSSLLITSSCWYYTSPGSEKLLRSCSSAESKMDVSYLKE